MGFDIALNAYPIRTNGTLRPERSESFPKYPLLNPAMLQQILRVFQSGQLKNQYFLNRLA